jgi:uncharacterized protein YifN (PemK superfamily)
MSPRSYNERHGSGPGRCIVVPFSVTQPPVLRPSDIFFATGTYEALSRDTWATCDSVMAVFHARLDRVRIPFEHDRRKSCPQTILRDWNPA